MLDAHLCSWPLSTSIYKRTGRVRRSTLTCIPSFASSPTLQTSAHILPHPLAPMHLRTLIAIVALLLTWPASSEGQFGKACMNEANSHCPGNQSNPGWMNHFRVCLQGHWHDASTNTKCPYRNIDCRTYNGCVAMQWRRVENVGAWCATHCVTPTEFPGCTP
ncbi:hypothetical protein V8E36_002197 [Tilletia maclaganii]